MKIYNIPRKEILQLVNSLNESLMIEVGGKIKDAKVIKLDEAEVILIEDRFQLVRKELYDFVISLGGDIARLGEERVVLTPPGVRVWRGAI